MIYFYLSDTCTLIKNPMMMMMMMMMSEGMENCEMSGEKSGNFEVDDKWQPCMSNLIWLWDMLSAVKLFSFLTLKLSANSLSAKKGLSPSYITVLEIKFLPGSKFLLPSIKVGSKTNILGSKFGGHITAHLTSVQVVIRFKTKQNPIWSKALTMPLTIWNYV